MLCRLQHPLVEKIQHGFYRKTTADNTNASCTIALSNGKCTVELPQSAKVQSATTINTEGYE